VFQIIPAGCRQCGLQLGRLLLVGLGQSPGLIGCKAEVTEHCTERLAAVNRVQELLAHVGRESLFRFAPSACPGLAALELAAFSAATSRIPPRHGAVGRTSATPSTLRIRKAVNLQQLRSRPWRPRNHSKRQPAPDDAPLADRVGGDHVSGCSSSARSGRRALPCRWPTALADCCRCCPSPRLERAGGPAMPES